MTDGGDNYEQFRPGRADELLDALIRYSGDCVKLMDLDGRVLRWNAACEEIYGWTANQVLGKPMPQVSELDRTKARSGLRAMVAAGRITESDVDSVRADGTHASMRMIAIPVVDEDGDPAGVLTIARELLGDERLDRQREEFSSYVGEGLSGPLHAIITASELLRRPEVAGDASRRTRLARLIEERARDASTVVEDLLLTSRLSAGDFVLDREPGDLSALVTRVVQDTPRAQQRVMLEFEAELGPVLMDIARVQRAVSILLHSALEQTPEDAHVQVSVYRRGDDAAVEVHDEGAPIDPAELHRIFDRHYSGSEIRATTDAGIGMYLVRGIAEAHGGAVFARSADGRGAVFVLVLPLAD